MAVAENDERPFVITIGSPKGGCGKTMTTILLAGEFAAGGYKVLVIDTDPQRSAVNWYETSKKAGYSLSNIEVQAITDLGDLAKKLEKPGDFQLVLVDIQGTAAAAVGSAVAFADFVVIPTRAHMYDVNGTIGMVDQVKLAGGRHRKIPFGILLNAVNGIDAKTTAFKLAMERLKVEGLKVMDSYLSQRPTFQAIATAGTLYETEGANKAIQDARDQTNTVAAEIIRRIGEEAA